MSVSRFGMVVLILVAAYVAFLATRFVRVPPPPPPAPHPRAADVRTVKSDLCRLEAAEHAFFETTGSYATESELRANGDDSLSTLSPWPYRYVIRVPAPEVFTIVAMHYGPLNDAPVAIVTDPSGQVCTVTPPKLRMTHQLDARPQWVDAAPTYDCEVCER